MGVAMVCMMCTLSCYEGPEDYNVRTVKVCYWALLLVVETRIRDFDKLYLFQTSSTFKRTVSF